MSDDRNFTVRVYFEEGGSVKVSGDFFEIEGGWVQVMYRESLSEKVEALFPADSVKYVQRVDE